MQDYLLKRDASAERQTSKTEQFASEVFAQIRDYSAIEQHKFIQYMKDNIRQQWEGLAVKAAEDIEKNQKGLEEIKELSSTL